MADPSVPSSPPAPSVRKSGISAYDNSNQIITRQLAEILGQLEFKLGGDCLTFIGPIVPPVDDFMRQALEDRTPKLKRLFVVLETDGGYIETAQRIAHTLRHHYQQVEFVIPNFAMSAGTVLVMSGDAIHMDYYSVLGPIDPQVGTRRSGMVPALGYLVQYERLIEKSRKGTLTTAELTYLVQNFNPAELYRYEQARDLSIALLKEWLVKYKFKNWTKTRTRKMVVTAAMRTRRADKIGRVLNDTHRWNSHGRGIPMDVLVRDVQLQIEDFGAESDLSEVIRRYYQLLKDFMAKLGNEAVIHWKQKYVPLA